ncbi:MAG TPA: glycosyltransferase N-terminal domain-containing protein [Phaeodactylibacter sp.]|nr:glycosyltransferase N-terminal domain-containing protein [Phaeodactylibacter sp.]
MKMGLYTLGIYLFGFAMRVAALFHPKARAWIEGRRGWKRKHKSAPSASTPLLWIHCASLGEFEQGRPVIEGLKAQLPQLRVLLTFFSPSGYEVRNNYAQADYVHYLPLDTPGNAGAFLDIWQPDIAVFVKYEFWYNHLQALQRRQIPVLLIAGLFRHGQLFFRPYGKPFRRILRGFDHLFVQNEASAQLLSAYGLEQHTAAGDTRIDRVWQIAQSAPKNPVVEAFVQQHPVLVIGSSWPEDERHLLPFVNENLPADWKVILAPHQIGESHLRDIEAGLQRPCLRYSEAASSGLGEKAQVLIIDNIGMLSGLYQYGKIAYIGGAFGSGLHNTLEPIAFGLPVLFGPKYGNFEEARYLVETGGGFVVSDTAAIHQHFQQLLAPAAYAQAAQAARQYIEQNQGASQVAIASIMKKIPTESTSE